MRMTSKWILGGVVTAALALLLSPALGGEGGDLTLSLIGGEGEPGGDATVTIQLDNDDGSAVSAGLDIDFNADDLTFEEPVATNCVLDDSIAATHVVAGRIIEPGVVNVEILVSGVPDPLPTLGNGPLAVCTFGIRGDASEGDMFPVVAANVFIGDLLGAQLPSTDVDGVITVLAPGGTPTATVTDTAAVPTETATAMATATATPTTPCEDDSDCPTGLSCQDGSCMPIDCDEDEDCPPGSTCVLPVDEASTSGVEQLGMCVPNPCETDDDCPDRSSCDEGGMCRPDFCDDNDDCEGDDVCASDGICSSTCDDDSQCDGGVCEEGTCVECRADSDCPANNTCVDNTCVPPAGFSLAVSPESQMGVPGGSASIEVVLSSSESSTSADSVSNSLTASEGLTIESCSVAGDIPGGIEGTPGTTVSATLGGSEGSVPTGTVYSCGISIADEAEGSLTVSCGDATVNGADVSCSGAAIAVQAPPTPTPTATSTATFTMTVIPPDTPTNTPIFSGEDDGCAVGPAPRSADVTSVMFLLVPALLLWSRRRS